MGKIATGIIKEDWFYGTVFWKQRAELLSGFYVSNEYPNSFICLRDIEEKNANERNGKRTRLKGYWIDIESHAFQKLEIKMQFGSLILQIGVETYELQELESENYWLSWKMLGGVKWRMFWRKFKAH